MSEDSGADGASAPARSAAWPRAPGRHPRPRTWPSSPRSAASPMKRSPVITASRRSRSRARRGRAGADGVFGDWPGDHFAGRGRPMCFRFRALRRARTVAWMLMVEVRGRAGTAQGMARDGGGDYGWQTEPPTVRSRRPGRIGSGGDARRPRRLELGASGVRPRNTRRGRGSRGRVRGADRRRARRAACAPRSRRRRRRSGGRRGRARRRSSDGDLRGVEPDGLPTAGSGSPDERGEGFRVPAKGAPPRRPAARCSR